MNLPRGDVSSLLGSVLSKLKDARRAGRGYLACCPAHDDRSPSLNVTLNERGDVLLKCYSGCEFSDIVAALDMKQEQLFADYDPERKGPPQTGVHERKPAPPTALTLAEFAAHKQLDAQKLGSLGVRDALHQGRPCIEFTHQRRDGTRARAHVRIALGGKDKWRWRSGDAIIAYEPDGGQLARQTERLCIVEGESDTLTLVVHGIAALGLPGSEQAKLIEPHHLEGVKHVFVIEEPGQGGEQFARKVPLRLDALKFQGGVHVVKLPGGAKDASALYQREPAGFAAGFAALLDRIQEPPPKSRALSDLFDDLSWDGVVLKTGFHQLDEALDDGGLTTGTLTVLLGGPGSKKTGLATQLADHLSRQGAAVLMLCADEPRKRVAQRLGQRAGWNRDGLRDLSEAGEATRAGAREREASLGRMLRLCDPRREDEARTLEEAFDELRRTRDAKARVLIVDSLQTAKSLGADTFDDPRARVDAKLALLKSMCDSGIIVVVVSETNRAFYNGDTKTISTEHVLAAAKESGGIEYAADLLIGLVKDKEAPDRVELLVAKCRLGGEPRFWLRWHRATAEMLPCGTGSDVQSPAESLRDLRARQELDELKRLVLTTLATRPGLSKTKLRLLLCRNKSAVSDAVDSLAIAGLVHERRKNEFAVTHHPGMFHGQD
jgi:KaiC/GvpD/RAD55 family RecA-like ATPase